MIASMKIEEAEKLKVITSFTNTWRQRFVKIYEHPTDNTRVITIGLPLVGGTPILCDEERGLYWQQLRENPPDYFDSNSEHQNCEFRY